MTNTIRLWSYRGPDPLAMPSQPKARLVAPGGRVFVFPYAPRELSLDGFGPVWSTVDRPGRTPLLVRDGGQLRTLAFSAVLADRDPHVSIEPLIEQLRAIVDAGRPVRVVNLSPRFGAGPWQITNLAVSSTLLQAGTNAITRATVALTFTEPSAGRARLEPVTGGGGGGGGGKARTYVVKKGDTLRTIARRFYDDASLWRRIANANKIKDPRNLKPGTRLRIPPAPDSGPYANPLDFGGSS